MGRMNGISVSTAYHTVDVIYSPTYEESRVEARVVLLPHTCLLCYMMVIHCLLQACMGK